MAHPIDGYVGLMTSAPALVAGRYRLAELLGRGGMGRVWLARDTVLDRDVAIKEIDLPAALVAGDREGAQRRTLREARAAARLSHRNVAQVYDVFQSGDRTWIVMEYVPSRSLQQVLDTDGPLEPRRVAEIGLEVLAVLDAAHRAGVRHRDVKPGNVLLGEDGRVVLTDFGIATMDGDSIITSSDVLVGSPKYMSPERARNGAALPASDLWSLGATLYAAVEGRPPYERESAIGMLTALATEEPDPPDRAGPLRPVLDGLLRKDPEDRIDIAEARRRLEAALSDKSSETDEPPQRYAGIATVRPAGAIAVLDAPAQPGPSPSAPSPIAPSPIAPPPTEPSPARPSPAEPPPAAPSPTGLLITEPSPIAPSPTAPSPTAPTPTAPTPTEPTPPAAAPPAAAPAPPRRNHRRLLLAAAVALLLLAGGLAAWFAVQPGRGEVAHGPATTTPPATGDRAPTSAEPGAGTATSAPTTAKSTRTTPTTKPATTRTTAGSSGRSRPALPAGWRDYHDSTGFSVYVPADWTRSKSGSIVYFRGGGRVLGIDQTDHPKSDPVADWENQSAYRVGRGDFPGYHEIRIVRVDYFRDAADWEFTFDGSTTRQHVNNRGFVVSSSKAYGIWWQTRDADWAAARPDLQLVFDSFRPA